MAEELSAEDLLSQEKAKMEAERAYHDAKEMERRDYEKSRDDDRKNHEILLEEKRAKLETIRLAKETLIENSRSKSVDERDVSAEDITSFAKILQDFILK